MYRREDGSGKQGGNGGNRLTFKNKGVNVMKRYVHRADRDFARTPDIVLALLVHLSSLIAGRCFRIFGKLGRSQDPWRLPRNAPNSIPRHSFRPSMAAGRSQLFARSRRSLLRATCPMPFLYTERKGETHRCVEEREGSHHRHSERGTGLLSSTSGLSMWFSTKPSPLAAYSQYASVRKSLGCRRSKCPG